MDGQVLMVIEKRLFKPVSVIYIIMHCTYNRRVKSNTLNKWLLKTILRLQGSACSGSGVSIL